MSLSRGKCGLYSPEREVHEKSRHGAFGSSSEDEEDEGVYKSASSPTTNSSDIVVTHDIKDHRSSIHSDASMPELDAPPTKKFKIEPGPSSAKSYSTLPGNYKKSVKVEFKDESPRADGNPLGEGTSSSTAAPSTSRVIDYRLHKTKRYFTESHLVEIDEEQSSKTMDK